MSDFSNRKAPEELSVSEIFSGVEYIIPIYQRNYAWGASEIEQLLEDIADSENKYYLGSLIVDKKNTGVYEVIDGQQRLTTLFLLMVYLYENDVKGISFQRNSLRFEARKKSNITLMEIKPGFISGKGYSGEIADGYNIIEKYFQKRAEENKCDKTGFAASFSSRLSEVKIIRTQVPDNIDLNHYFEIMNTRGEQLELHEIAKAKLLKVIEDKKNKETASDIWNACSGMDKYVQMNFKKDIREIIFGDDWNDFCIDSFEELREKIGESTKGGEDRKTLKEILDSNENFKSSEPEDPEENERFESVISFPNFLLQVNAAMKRIENEEENLLDDKKLLDLLDRHFQKNDDALKFIFYMLKYRYLFDKYIIKREYAKDYKDDGKWSLQQLKVYTDNSKNRNKKANYVSTHDKKETDDTDYNNRMKMLQSCLRVTYTSPKTMHWISGLLYEIFKQEKINADIPVDVQIKFLEEYASSKVKASDYENSSGFGYARIVFTYLDYLLWRDNVGKFNDFQFKFRNSIEHFYPQNPVAQTLEEKQDWTPENLNDFGNLALLTVSANSKFSNLLPASKIDTFKDEVPQSPKLVLMSELIGDEKWTSAKAKKHGEMMKEILRSGRGTLSEK